MWVIGVLLGTSDLSMYMNIKTFKEHSWEDPVFNIEAGPRLVTFLKTSPLILWEVVL